VLFTQESLPTPKQKRNSPPVRIREEKIRIFKIYSDPGYTGANLNRPVLQELLEDIKQSNIDVVLVYKIDRIIRSPEDFY